MAAYTLYDVLRILIDGSRYSEPERAAMRESVDDAERVGVLGNAARIVECSHPNWYADGRPCPDCGKTNRL